MRTAAKQQVHAGTHHGDETERGADVEAGQDVAPEVVRPGKQEQRNHLGRTAMQESLQRWGSGSLRLACGLLAAGGRVALQSNSLQLSGLMRECASPQPKQAKPA